MIGRVGEKETGTPLLNSISKMSLFRLLPSCLPILPQVILKELLSWSNPHSWSIINVTFLVLLV